MTDPNLSEIDSKWEFFHETILQPSSFPPPSHESNLDIYSLSPLLFEECSLDILWNTRSELPVPQVNIRVGLKDLSWNIKEVIEKQRVSTFKQVADELISELVASHGSSKDIKNIRRRIYDALNVLTAADVLEKRGKTIVLKSFYKAASSSSINKKRERLRSLMESYVAVRSLYEQNSLSKVAKKVPYPLSLITLKDNSQYDVSFKQMQISKSGSTTKATVFVKGEHEVLRDVNILKKLGLHRKIGDLPVEIKAICREL